MSCYGLGITRILGVLMDNCSSSNQIRWPTALAPFDVSIIMPKVLKPFELKSFSNF